MFCCVNICALCMHINVHRFDLRDSDFDRLV